MPKLNTEVARKVDEAEDGFKPVPEGIYVLQLMADVDVKEGTKAPYWRWSFEIPAEHDGKDLEYSGRKFWTNTSLSDAAYFKLKETFAAFGVPTDTDTEELVGKRVKALITTKVIQGGQRAGEIGNEIEKLFPIDHEGDATAPKGVSTEKALAGATAGGGSDDEPMF